MNSILVTHASYVFFVPTKVLSDQLRCWHPGLEAFVVARTAIFPLEVFSPVRAIQ